MSNIKSTVSIAGKVGTSTRSISSTVSKSINAVVDKEVVVNAGDVPQVLLEFESGTAQKGSIVEKSTGSNLSGAQQIIIQNNDNSSCAEIIFHLESYNGSDAFEAQRYLSCLLPAGRMITLPNARMVIYAALQSAGNKTSQNFASVSVASSAAYYVDKFGGGVTTNGVGGWGHQALHTATGGTSTQGVVPGSLRMAFYDAGFQHLSMVKNGEPAQTSATEPGLAANTAYAIGLTVDGGTESNNSFTTDSSDVTWGSPTSGNGILAKIQADLDNTNRGCDVAIVDGDIRFTSQSKVSGTSAIALGNPGGSGTTIFGVGNIPAVGSLIAARAATLNTEPDNILWDNGDSTMTRPNGGSGYISYGSKSAGVAALEFTGCPSNSTIKAAWDYDSPHSGYQIINAGTNSNSINGIYARSVPHKDGNGANADGERLAKIRVTAWE